MTELDDLLTPGRVAETLGLTLERVRQLRKEPGFPAPIGKLAGVAIFRRNEVEAYARERVTKSERTSSEQTTGSRP